MSNLTPNFANSLPIENIAQAIGVFLTFVTTLIVVYRKYVKAPLQTIRELVTFREEVAQISQKTDTIAKQMERNGGSSMADKIAQIAESVAEIGERQKYHLFRRNEELGLFETDSAGSWTIVNPLIPQIMGRSELEILGQGWTNAIVREQRQQIVQEYFDAIKFQRIYEVELAFQNNITGVRTTATLKLAPLSKGNRIFAWSGELSLINTEENQHATK